MSFFNDASLVFLPSGAAGKDGKAYSIKPVPEFGSEKVTNGTFSTDSDWTKGTGWTISGGTASCDGSQSGNSILYQNISHSANKKYRVEFTISGYVSGQVDFALDTPFFGATTSNGTFIFDAIPPSGGNFIIRADADFVGSIDNVSVKEITKTGDFTFSRGSNLAATRVGADGLIEKGRENLLKQSNNFDTSPWTNSSATLTSGQSGYDGSSDAWLFNSDATGQSYINQAVSQGGVQTFSVYLKKGTADFATILVRLTASYTIYIDLRDGSYSNPTFIFDEINIEDVGNDWWRVKLRYNASVSFIRIFVADSLSSFDSAVGSNILIQDAQLEIGLAATDVIETGATTGKAGLLEDEPRFDYSGGATCPSLLLEPSRTQLIPQSEYINNGGGWSGSGGLTTEVNSIDSPEGVTNGTKVVIGSNQYGELRSAAISQSATTSTISMFAKAGNLGWCIVQYNDSTASNYIRVWFNISTGAVGSNAQVGWSIVGTPAIEDYGNGWYRCSIVLTTTATGTNRMVVFGATGDSAFGATENSYFYTYGAQVEQDATYPTSYIPTYGTSQTRVGENNAMNVGATGTFGTLASDESGTAFIETKINSLVGNKFSLVGTGGSLNWFYQGNNFYAYRTGGVLQWGSLPNVSTLEGTSVKFAFKKSALDVTLFINGENYGTQSLQSGQDFSAYYRYLSTYLISQSVSKYIEFPTALSDDECIELTTI